MGQKSSLFTDQSSSISDTKVKSIFMDNKLFRREEIIQSLKLAFISSTKSDMPIYGIKSKDLREYTTTDKDVEKGKSRIPDKSVNFLVWPLAINRWGKPRK